MEQDNFSEQHLGTYHGFLKGATIFAILAAIILSALALFVA